MEYLGQILVIAGAVFWSWLLIELRERSEAGCSAMILLNVLGLLFGGIVQVATGSNALLIVIVLSVFITAIVEVSRLF